jgi:flagellin-like protein
MGCQAGGGDDGDATDRAVSPVIGSILMVAIVVLLSAVLGTFVLGIGSQSPTKPVTTFEHEVDRGLAGGPSSDWEVRVTYTGGDTVRAENLIVKIDGSRALDGGGTPLWTGSGELSPGDSVVVDDPASGTSSTGLALGDRVRVIWVDPGSGESFVLDEFVVEQG